ncbi:MAG TPA: hypothetical protein VF326_14250 [Anaerolineaceae bacterium]
MDIFIIFLRSIHILSGIFWVGTAFFFVLFLEPTLKAAGPAGGTVMGRLTLTRFPLLMAVASILTVVIGFVMYLIDSHGFQANWILSAPGISMTIGSLAGIAAFIEGLVVQMPASNRMAALQKEILAAGGQPTPAQMKEMQSIQEKITNASRSGAVLMLIAVLGMAIARELGNL